jgi:DNA-binding PadR family transcriptional regulator
MNEILFQILGRTDAIFHPRCGFAGDQESVVWERRHFYTECGLRWVSHGDHAALRKASERCLKTLEGDGLIESYRAGGRITHVRLTNSGDQRARAECGLPGLSGAVKLFQKIQRLIDSGDVVEDRYVAETGLGNFVYDNGGELGGNWQGHRSKLARRLMPLLSRGLVDSNCCDARIFYTLTESGRRAIEKPPAPLSNLPKCDPTAADIWAEAWVEEFEDMQTAAKTLKSNIGIFPEILDVRTRNEITAAPAAEHQGVEAK